MLGNFVHIWIFHFNFEKLDHPWAAPELGAQRQGANLSP